MVIADNPLNQFPNLIPGERLDDPCLCSEGCPGVKVMPDNPRVKKLPIQFPCADCPLIRTTASGKYTVHPQRCQPCARRRADQRKDNPATAKFHAVLMAALVRTGISKSQAMTEAGLHRGTLSQWLSGDRNPLRHHLVALANVLDAPELVDAISWRTSGFRVTCPDCKEIRPLHAHNVRAWVKDGGDETMVNWDTGTATYRCSRCASSANRTAYHKKLVKDGFAYTRVEAGKRLAESQTYEQQLERIKVAQRASIGVPQTAERRFKISAKTISPTPHGQWGICRICETYAFQHNDGQGLVEFHKDCLNAWRAENMAGNLTQLPPRRTKLKPNQTPDKIAKLCELTVRALLRKEPIGEEAYYSKDDTWVKATGLIAEFGITRRTVFQRQRTFIDLMPSDGQGAKWLARLAEVLQWADANRPKQPTAPPKAAKKLTKKELAVLLLDNALAEGPVNSYIIYDQAKEQDISERTLERTIRDGRYKSERVGGFGANGHWELRKLRSHETK